VISVPALSLLTSSTTNPRGTTVEDRSECAMVLIPIQNQRQTNLELHQK
jgi:hypothetical protein